MVINAAAAAAAAMVSEARQQGKGLRVGRMCLLGVLFGLLALPEGFLVFRTTAMRGGENPRKRLLFIRTYPNLVVVAEIASARWWKEGGECWEEVTSLCNKEWWTGCTRGKGEHIAVEVCNDGFTVQYFEFLEIYAQAETRPVGSVSIWPR